MPTSTPPACAPDPALELLPAEPETIPDRLPLGGLLALAAVATWIVVTELFPAAVLPQLGAALRVAPGQVGYLASGFAIAATCAAIPFVALTAGLPASAAVAGLIGWRATFAALAVLGAVLIGWIRATIPALGGEPA